MENRKYYLKIESSIVAQSDEEANLVNLAASYDSDYEIVTYEELSEAEKLDLLSFKLVQTND